MPAVPKSAATRQRRNRTSTAAKRSAPAWRVPDLPPFGELFGGRVQWHPQTVAQWNRMRNGPFADEYIEADFDEMIALARLWDARNKTRDPVKMMKFMVEIRLQGQRFGLTPIDRRRLQWEVDRGDEAEQRTTQRRQRKAATRAVEEDPLNYLKAVK